MPRLFVALPLPEAVRLHLALLAGGVPGARWTTPENIHLTLRFLGDVGETAADDLADGLGMISAEPFSLRIAGLGQFGDRRRARVLWAGIETCGELLALRAVVESLVARLGFSPEGRRYSPHVTLARMKGLAPDRLAPFLEAHAGLALAPFAVDRFQLLSSHRGRERAHYRVEAEYPLGDGEAAFLSAD